MSTVEHCSTANLAHGQYARPLRDNIAHQSAALCEWREQQARRCLSPAGHLVKSAYLRDRCAYHSHLQYPLSGRAQRNYHEKDHHAAHKLTCSTLTRVGPNATHASGTRLLDANSLAVPSLGSSPTQPGVAVEICADA